MEFSVLGPLEDAPRGAVKTVQVHVSRLRKALGDPEVLATTRAGYRLRVRPGELDAERFEQHVRAGRQALAAARPEAAPAAPPDPGRATARPDRHIADAG